MQSACSGGTGTFIEKTARKLQVPGERLAAMPYEGMSLHKVSSKCGIFAETDANTLVKTGRAGRGDHRQPVRGGRLPEPGHPDQGQHARARGAAARRPQPLLQGTAGGVAAPPGQALDAAQGRSRRPRRPAELIVVPSEALYYACLGCIEIGGARSRRSASTRDATSSRGGSRRASTKRRPRRARGAGRRHRRPGDVRRRVREARADPRAPTRRASRTSAPVLLGCDFGSTTAKAVVLSRTASSSSRATRSARATRSRTPRRSSARCARPGSRTSARWRSPATARDLLTDVLGADRRRGGDGRPRDGRAALLSRRRRDLRRGRHRRQDHDPAPGHRRRLPPELAVLVRQRRSSCRVWPSATTSRSRRTPDRAFEAKAMPSLTMGCGVFLQSDIVNQQRKGWSAEEIMAALAAVLPVNVLDLRAASSRICRRPGASSSCRAAPTATWRW